MTAFWRFFFFFFLLPKFRWGCHSQWKPENYATFTDYELRSALIPVDLQSALEHLYERLGLDGNSIDNWNAALTELGLTTVLEDEVANDN